MRAHIFSAACQPGLKRHLLGDGFPIGARIAGAIIHACPVIVLDGIAAAHALRVAQLHRDLMTLIAKAFDDLRRNAIFDEEVATGKIALGEARSLERGFDVHVKIHDVGNELCMRLRLVEAALDAEGNPLIALLHESRDDGLQWTGPRTQRVRLSRLERKTAGAILQHEACPLRNQAAAEVSVNALDKRNFVAVAVDNREIGGVARQPGKLFVQVRWQHVALGPVRNLLGAPRADGEAVPEQMPF